MAKKPKQKPSPQAPPNGVGYAPIRVGKNDPPELNLHPWVASFRAMQPKLILKDGKVSQGEFVEHEILCYGATEAEALASAQRALEDLRGYAPKSVQPKRARGRQKGSHSFELFSLKNLRILQVYRESRERGDGYDLAIEAATQVGKCSANTVKKVLWHLAPTLTELSRLMKADGRTKAEIDKEVRSFEKRGGPYNFQVHEQPPDPVWDAITRESLGLKPGEKYLSYALKYAPTPSISIKKRSRAKRHTK